MPKLLELPCELVPHARVIALTTMLGARDLVGADATIPDFTAIQIRREHDGFVVTMS